MVASLVCCSSDMELLPSISRLPNIAFSGDRKSTRLNSSHLVISYAVFCLKKKNEVDYEILAEPGAEHRGKHDAPHCYERDHSAAGARRGQQSGEHQVDFESRSE